MDGVRRLPPLADTPAVVRNGRPAWSSRLTAAWRCLRGRSLMFNVRIAAYEHAPVKLSGIDPTAWLFIQSCLLWSDPDDPPLTDKVEIGDGVFDGV